jgi:2-hydroxychromene-2-carboxylate isomerase
MPAKRRIIEAMPDSTDRDRSQACADPRVPLVVLDLASVESYFLAQPLSCLAFEAQGAVWAPLISAPAPLDLDRAGAQRRGDALQLELAWPARHPRPRPAAMRVAALACAHGLGADFMLAMSRLAWGSGRDMDSPDEHEFLAAELGLAFTEVRAAAREDSAWDLELASVAEDLAPLGIKTAPALRWQGQLYLGSEQILALLDDCQSLQSRL